MIIKDGRREIEIDHRGFVYFADERRKQQDIDLYIDWSELSAAEEMEVLQLRQSVKIMLDRAMALYERLLGTRIHN